MIDREDWNINKGFGDLLTGLIDNINKSARDGDIKLWFNSLRILYRNVAGHKRMDIKVMEEVDKSLKSVRDKLDFDNAITEQGRARQKLLVSEIKNELDEINIILITAMHKAGLILPTSKSNPNAAVFEI